MSPQINALIIFSEKHETILMLISKKRTSPYSHVIQAIIEKCLRRLDAASQLQLTDRQVQ
ncbi:hypothetical protein ACJ2_42850 [Pantoea sp. QMID2]|nr:hypothetical protein ACJ3_42860 [Pantoea sp. QMID3]GME47372.1 hypothetical protein ACJ1_42360 [Pantoea sp. QMID1]GME62277.1 hypothetical protein ACJ4_42740 [Pantoea sp. QMID4]GME63597.1 hypothetical protein ACJ2_42850 [Pantoea sp. QMID2]